jgi:hypothetical protein
MSDFWRDDEACHANVTIGDGPLEVLRLCRMVNLGCNAAIKSDPLANLNSVSHRLPPENHSTYPMAYVLQSAAGANAVIGIWSIVLAEICSEVDGSNKITFPCALPANMLA